MKQLPGGLWPVMLTPFTEEGEIDFPGLESLTEFYLDAGAKGLFANCLSSEMFHLSPAERLSVTEAVIRVADGRVPVASTGTFGSRAAENAGFMKALRELGVASVVVNSNQLGDETQSEDHFLEKLEELVEETPGMMLGIYECPVPYKRLLSGKVISWLASSGRFNYFKDTSCDDELIRERLQLAKGSPLSLFNANTPTALQSLHDGAAGISPIGANFYPELYSFLVAQSGEKETDLFREVRSFLSVADLVVHSIYPFSAKYFLQRRGLPISLYSRTPVPAALREEMIRLDELFNLAEDLVTMTSVRSFRIS